MHCIDCVGHCIFYGMVLNNYATHVQATCGIFHGIPLESIVEPVCRGFNNIFSRRASGFKGQGSPEAPATGENHRLLDLDITATQRKNIYIIVVSSVRKAPLRRPLEILLLLLQIVGRTLTMGKTF